MKEFRNYIIDNCNSTSIDYFSSIYISYTLFNKISQLFDLDEIMLLENDII